jgi:hypothetical protein
MARDVEYNITASDRSGAALAAAEAKFKASQEHIDKINKEHSDKRQKDLAESAASIGRRLETVFGATAPKLAQSLAGGFAQAGEMAGPLLAAGVAAAAPLLGAVVSAGIIGGAGVGGVIGGVLLAAKDPRVAGAGKQLGENMLSSLKQDASVFIEPVLQGIGQIDAAFERLRPRIQKIFSNSSQFVAPLTDGVIRATDGILRGFQKLTDKAGPVIDQLSDSIGDLGEATGDALSTISGGSESAAKGLGDVTDKLSLLIRTSGFVIRGLTEVYGAMDKLKITTTLLGPLGQVYDLFTHGSDEATKAADEHKRALGLLADSYERDQEGIERTNQYLADSQKLMDDAAAAAADLTNSNRSLYDSETNVAAALARATEARKENGRTLDVNTAKGRANRDALSSVARAARDEYDAFVKVNGVGPKSAALADTLRGKFIALAEKMGASKTQANNLANSILGIPGKKDVKITANAKPAIDGARSAQSAINGVHGRNVSVNVIVNDARLRSVENRLNRLGGSMYGAAGQSWAAVDGSSGNARTGGPAAVTLTSQVNVNLDGRPFHAATVAAVQASERRNSWRAKVGTRSRASVI